MKKLISLLLVAGACFSVVACNKDEKKDDKAADKKDDKKDDKKADKKDDKAGGGGEIGVAECDDYIKKAKGCTNWPAGTPDEAKKAWDDAFKQTTDAWKQVPAGPGRDALKTGCKAALDALAAAPNCGK